MRTYWIVVANGGRACIYCKAQGLAGLDRVHQLDNPSGRQHIGEIIEDQRGRMEKHGSGIRSAMNPAQDVHEQVALEFARDICRILDAAAGHRSYDELVIFAPAHFLGLVRSELSAATKKLSLSFLAKDLTHLTLADLEGRLRDLLHFQPVETASVNSLP